MDLSLELKFGLHEPTAGTASEEDYTVYLHLSTQPLKVQHKLFSADVFLVGCTRVFPSFSYEIKLSIILYN